VVGDRRIDTGHQALGRVAVELRRRVIRHAGQVVADQRDAATIDHRQVTVVADTSGDRHCPPRVGREPDCGLHRTQGRRRERG
jgi:hypothetical protein